MLWPKGNSKNFSPHLLTYQLLKKIVSDNSSIKYLVGKNNEECFTSFYRYFYILVSRVNKNKLSIITCHVEL